MYHSSHDKFPGFKKEYEKSYWQFPTIINGHVHSLSGAEFKVLWYILRHTFGWQKNADYLSLSQIRNGIKKRDGTWIDKGTGLSRPSIVKVLISLEDKGFIVVEKRSGKTNKITPHFSDVDNLDGLVKKVPQSSKESLLVGRDQTSKESLHTINIPTNNINRVKNKERVEKIKEEIRGKLRFPS